MPKFSLGQIVYVDRPPLVTLSTDRNADKLGKLLPRTYGPFQALHITEHTLTVDEDAIPNAISMHRATFVALSINHRHRPIAWKTSFEDYWTPEGTSTMLALRKTDGNAVTLQNDFTEGHKDSNMEMALYPALYKTL